MLKWMRRHHHSWGITVETSILDPFNHRWLIAVEFVNELILEKYFFIEPWVSWVHVKIITFHLFIYLIKPTFYKEIDRLIDNEETACFFFFYAILNFTDSRWNFRDGEKRNNLAHGVLLQIKPKQIECSVYWILRISGRH